MAASALPLPPPSPRTPTLSRSYSIFSPSPHPKPQTPPTIRFRLSKICQEGNPQLARQLFDTIPKPTTVLWNTIIIGFICNNFPNEALLFYSRMKKSFSFTKCDSYTYSSTLKACAMTKDLRIGKAVHCHFIRCFSNPSRIVYNSLLNMYVACLNTSNGGIGYSRYDVVRKVFGSMPKRDVVAWNTLISWYVKTERYLEAVRQFKIMMRFGIRPSPVSFVNVFPALASFEDVKKANVFYGLLLRLGSDYVSDLFVVSSAILTYADLGQLNYSRKLFELCLERNIEIWNTMINAYIQNDFPVEGIELFLQAMASEEIVPDEVTFLSVLSAVSVLQDMELGQQLHAFVVKNFKELPVVILNALVVMYSRCGAVYKSFRFFDAMPERDAVSWNTMISAFVQNCLDEEGLLLVYEMQKQGHAVDCATATALLSAASNLRNEEIGKQTHAFLIRHNMHFEGVNTYLIDMYSKCGLIITSRKLFEKTFSVDRDQATWNAMLSGYAQNGLTEKAFGLLRQMVEKSVIPNAVTLASLLSACSQTGSIDLGKQLHGFSIRHSFDQNVFVGTALVDMYSKSGAVGYAENVFVNAKERNSVTYTTMILGYGQHGMGKRALSLFHSMELAGIKPDAITFVAVLSACSYSGLVDEGFTIFRSMEKFHKIQPSAEHYCCVADMLGRAGRVKEAYEFVKKLGEEGNTIELWGSLLGACRLHGELELGEIVAKKLTKLDKGEDFTGYCVLLSNMYAEEANWKNVDRMRKDMREKGVRKEVGCSWIEVAGRANYFKSKDQEHPESNQIHQMLHTLVEEMKSCSSPSSPNLSTNWPLGD